MQTLLSMQTSILLLAPWFAMVSNNIVAEAAETIVRRAAFDLGSGFTKLLVADVDTTRGIIVGKPVFQMEMPMRFKFDVQQQPDGRLSEKIQNEGLALLGRMMHIARKNGAVQGAGVGTNVFRIAPNGPAYLQRIRKHLNLNIEVVDQDQETRLGLATAQAQGAPINSASWDSGAGSFQIAARDSTCTEEKVSELATCDLKVYAHDGIGVASVFKLLNDIKHNEADATPNPVSKREANDLLRSVKDLLKKNEDAHGTKPPGWITLVPVVSIGAWNSQFEVILRAAHPEWRGNETSIPPLTDRKSISLKEARRALDKVLGKSDDELRVISGFSPDADPPAHVVPKIATFVAIVEHLHIMETMHIATTGSCAGLMALGTFVNLPNSYQGLLTRVDYKLAVMGIILIIMASLVFHKIFKRIQARQCKKVTQDLMSLQVLRQAPAGTLAADCMESIQVAMI